MYAVGALAAVTTPTPTPTVDPDLVTPGPGGFIVIVLLVVAVVFLVWDMLRRIRRMRYREEVRDQLDEEERVAREREAGGSAPGAPATGDGPTAAAGDATTAPEGDPDDPKLP